MVAMYIVNCVVAMWYIFVLLPVVFVLQDKTAEAIQQCERFILTPYANALKLVNMVELSSQLQLLCVVVRVCRGWGWESI